MLNPIGLIMTWAFLYLMSVFIWWHNSWGHWITILLIMQKVTIHILTVFELHLQIHKSIMGCIHECCILLMSSCRFQVSEKLLEGRELEFNTWEGDVQELMKEMRKKLNMLGEVHTWEHFYLFRACFLLEHLSILICWIFVMLWQQHWSRDEKNKCLREATKSFRFMGQIVRLIILWS